MDKNDISRIYEATGLNRVDFAERLGVTQAQVSRLLSGTRVAQGSTLKLLEQMRSRYRKKLEAAECSG